MKTCMQLLLNEFGKVVMYSVINKTKIFFNVLSRNITQNSNKYNIQYFLANLVSNQYNKLYNYVIW